MLPQPLEKILINEDVFGTYASSELNRLINPNLQGNGAYLALNEPLKDKLTEFHEETGIDPNLENYIGYLYLCCGISSQKMPNYLLNGSTPVTMIRRLMNDFGIPIRDRAQGSKLRDYLKFILPESELGNKELGVMYYTINGYKTKEIAQTLNMPKRAVTSAWTRIIRKYQNKLPIQMKDYAIEYFKKRGWHKDKRVIDAFPLDSRL